jgi:hypothetical protein
MLMWSWWVLGLLVKQMLSGLTAMDPTGMAYYYRSAPNGESA